MPRLAALAFLLLAVLSPALRAAPALNNVSPRGLQSGGTTTLTFVGGDLGPECRLVASFPITKQEVVAGANAAQVQIVVTLDASVPPGIYAVRLAHARGISNPITLGIDPLSQQMLAADAPVSLPVALTGDLQGASVLRAKFAGKKGQRVSADVEGRRLGSNVRPVLRLLDSRGVQIAFSPPERRMFGDARCEAVLAADGEYSVELHDLTYRGPAPGFFRLKLGDLHYADAAFPPAVTRNAKTGIESALATRPAPRVEVQVQQTGTHAPAPLADMLGPLPRLAVSDEPEFVEPAGAPAEPMVTPPATVGLSGRLATAGEEDRFRVPVLQGAKLRIEVQADRLGSPLDAVLSIRGEKGNQLAAADDQSGTTDPGLDFTVPQGVDEIVVAVKDMLGRGGPDYVYHIDVVRDDQPDFELAIDGDRLDIPAGGSALLRVQALRDGYAGPIQLAFPGLPAGVTVAGNVIPAGAAGALVTFSAPAGGSGAGLFRVVGTSTETNPPRVREAEGPDSQAGQFQPWLRGELGVAVVAAAPGAIAFKGGEEKAFTGGKSPLAVTLTRGDTTAGPVRLSLLSTQPMPKKNVTLPPPKGRKKVPVRTKEEEAPERALRLDGMPVIAAGMNEGMATLLVPGDVPSGLWQIAVKAEFLAADGKTVVATAYTPARNLESVRSLTLELTGKPEVSAKANAGDTGKLTGKLVRGPGLAGPVTLTLANLPKDYAMPPKIEIAADKSDFEWPVSFPAGSKQGDVPNVLVVATIRKDASDANSGLESNGVPIGLKVVP